MQRKKIVGCVVDCDCNKIVGAEAMAVDCQGRMLDKCQTDEYGQFELKPSNTGEGTFILFKANGCQPVLTTADVVEKSSQIQLKAMNPAAKYMPALIIVALIAGIYAGEKERGDNAVGSVNYTPFILLAVLGAGGIALYMWLTGDSSPFKSGQAQNNSQTTATNTTATQQDAATLAAQGVNPTFTQSAFAQAANDIYSTATATWDSPLSQSDQDAIMWDVMNNINNAADLNALIAAFGTKKIGDNWYSVCFSLGFGCDAVGLGSFLKIALDSSHITEINNYLNSLNINYQF